MGCHVFFLEAIGHDYIDGAVITYLLLTLLFLTLSGKKMKTQVMMAHLQPGSDSGMVLSPLKGILLFLAGVAMAAMLLTHLFSAIFIPVILFYFLITHNKSNKRYLFISLALFSLGFIILTIVLGTVNAIAGGDFLFFLPQLYAALYLAGRPDIFWRSIYEWATQAIWLVYPAVICVSSIIFVAVDLYRGYAKGIYWLGLSQLIKRNFFNLSFIFIFLLMLSLQCLGSHVLQAIYYASYLIPFMFLALGSQVYKRVVQLGARQFVAVTGLLILLLTLPYYPPLHDAVSSIYEKVGAYYILILSIISLLGIIIFQVKRSTDKPEVILIILSFILLSTSSLLFVSRIDAVKDVNGIDFYQDINRKINFITVQKSLSVIEPYNTDFNKLFWFARNDKFGYTYWSIAMNYSFFHLVSDGFPAIDGGCHPMDINKENAKILLGKEIIILTTDENAFDKANNSLNKYGLSAQLTHEERIKQGEIQFKMIFIRVTEYFVSNNN